MANEVSGVGKGYFTEKGELKSQAQVSKEESTQKASPDNQSEAVKSETTISGAVGSVRTRFLEKANAIANVINEDQENLKQAAAAVKEQLTAARELKSALKEGNDDDVAEAKAKLEKATEQRNLVADSIRKDNDRLVTQRSKSLSVGSEQLGIVKVQAVKFEKSEEVKIENVKDVNKLIDSLKNDRSSITAQRQELIDVRNEVKSIVQTTDSQLSKVEENTLRSFEEAESKTQDLAARITANGAQAISASKISENIVRQLLQ